MSMTVVGIGAAGNKAAIKLIENKIISKNCVTLLNTNSKDIPFNYADLAIQFSTVSKLEGSGKEPKVARESVLAAIKNGKFNVAELAKFGENVTATDNAVVIVTSTEGGTGSGATPIIAKYFLAMGYPVHVFTLVGFGEDTKSLRNTLEFLNNMDDNIILHAIKNSEFLDYTGNFAAAEEAANEEFAKQVSILSGGNLIPSTQNIDSADLFGATTTPKYMDIQHISLSGVKNVETFNKAIQDAYDNNKGFGFDKSAKKLAVIINASESMQNNIDYTFEVAKRFIGEPYKIYKQVQYDPNQSEYIEFIASGINFPEKEIRELNSKYQELKAKATTKTNSISDIFKDISFDDDDDFEVKPKRIVNPDDLNSIFTDSIVEKKSDKDIISDTDNF